MTRKPKVSILCLTYNQEQFIRQTLDGFMAQETDFKFEVLINDDASTDKTVEIIKEYQKQYPGIIRATLQPKNQYSQGFRGMLTETLLPQASGDYIAICEGDDYWTDPQKLQLQVDFLEAHPDYSVCFHKVRVVYEDGSSPDQIYPDVADPNWYTKEQLLRANYIQTNSVMYRKQKYTHIVSDVMPGDWYLHLYHAQFGKIKLLDKVMSVYRKHPGGIWWNYDVDRNAIWRQHGLAYVNLLNEQLHMFGDNKNRRSIIEQSVFEMFTSLVLVDEQYGDNQLEEVINRFPVLCKLFINQSHRKQQETQQALSDAESRIAELLTAFTQESEKLAAAKASINELTLELNRIRDSRTWRLSRKVANLKGASRKKNIKGDRR